MRLLDHHYAGAAGGPSAPAPPTGRRPQSAVLVALGVFALALALRLVRVDTAYSVFIDETTYTAIARSIATGHGLRLYGAPFTLHPPLVLATDGAVLGVHGAHGSPLGAIDELRRVSAVFGALGVAAVFWVLRSCRLPLGVSATGALLLAIDPFALSFDSRVLLEPETALFAFTTVGLLVMSTRQAVGRRARVIVVAAGVLGAATFSSKETFGLVLGLALVLMIVTGWGVRRRDATAVLAISLVGYGLTVLGTVLDTGVEAWWTQKRSGLERLIGTTQTTGFNAPSTHVSLTSRLLANAGQDATTYALLALGVLAGVVLVLRDRRRRAESGPEARATVVIGLWTVSATAYLLYATFVGSLEEQMYDILLGPCVLSVVIVGWQVVRPRLDVVRGAARWAARPLLPALVVVAVVADASVYAHVRSGDNNVYGRLSSWAAMHVPVGSTVSVTDGTSQFLLGGVRLGDYPTVDALVQHGVDYVVLSPHLVEQGYGDAREPFETYLDQHATVVFTARDYQGDDIRVYDVRAITGAP